MGKLIVTTQDELSGFEITHTLGLVDGSGTTIHSQYRANESFLEEKLEEARAAAIEGMLAKAEARDANAVVGVRFDSTGIYNGSAGTQAFTIHAYGTAVITRLRT